jgi:hypothetical protein
MTETIKKAWMQAAPRRIVAGERNHDPSSRNKRSHRFASRSHDSRDAPYNREQTAI